MATYICCLRSAGAPRRTREWFCAFVCRSFPTCHPLRPRGAARCMYPVPSRCAFAFAGELSARHSRCWRFRGLQVHHCYDLLSCSPPLQETFTSGLSTVRSPSPLPDITTVATGQAPPAGLTPAGPTTSVAAQLPPPHSTPLAAEEMPARLAHGASFCCVAKGAHGRQPLWVNLRSQSGLNKLHVLVRCPL